MPMARFYPLSIFMRSCSLAKWTGGCFIISVTFFSFKSHPDKEKIYIYKLLYWKHEMVSAEMVEEII